MTANSLIQIYGKDGGLILKSTLQAFFKPLWDPANPRNINSFLNLLPNIECDAFEELDSVSETFCLDTYYDTRIIFDESRDRFWIVSLARNGKTRDSKLVFNEAEMDSLLFRPGHEQRRRQS